jgi:fatty-acyl-CoA synthase
VQPVREGSPSRDSILEFLAERVAKHWLPDQIVFVDSLPLGATGKVQKVRLREKYGGREEASSA